MNKSMKKRRARTFVVVMLVSLVYIFAPDELFHYAGRMLLLATGGSVGDQQIPYRYMLVVGSSWGDGASQKKQATYYPSLVASDLGMKSRPTLLHIHNHNQNHRPPVVAQKTLKQVEKHLEQDKQRNKQQSKKQHGNPDGGTSSTADSNNDDHHHNSVFRFSSLCIFSMIRKALGSTIVPHYDVIVMEYPDDHDPDYLHFSQTAMRLRHRFPNATMVLLNLWYPLSLSTSRLDDNDDSRRYLARHNMTNTNSGTSVVTTAQTVGAAAPDVAVKSMVAAKILSSPRSLTFPDELVALANTIDATVCELPRPGGRRMRSLKRLEAWQKYFHWDARHFSTSGHAAVGDVVLKHVLQQRERDDERRRVAAAARAAAIVDVNDDDHDDNKEEEEEQGDNENTPTTDNVSPQKQQQQQKQRPFLNDDCCNVWYETGWTRNHQANNNLVSSYGMKMIQLPTTPRRYALETTLPSSNNLRQKNKLATKQKADKLEQKMDRELRMHKKKKRTHKLSALEQAVKMMDVQEQKERDMANMELSNSGGNNSNGIVGANNKVDDDTHWLDVLNPLSVPAQIHVMYMKSPSSSQSTTTSIYPAVHATLSSTNNDGSNGQDGNGNNDASSTSTATTDKSLSPMGVLLDPVVVDDYSSDVVTTQSLGTVEPGRTRVALTPLQRKRRGFRLVGILVTPLDSSWNNSTLFSTATN